MSTTFLLIGLIIFLGSIAQGATGVGLGIMATPFVAALDPTLVPGPVLVLMAVAASWTALRDRKDIVRGWLGVALIGRLPGSVLGAWLLTMMSFKVYAWAFAILVTVGVLMSVIGQAVAPTRRRLLAGGFGSGLMGTLTAIGGPPIMLVMQSGSAPHVRATISSFFAVGSLLSLSVLAWFGQFGMPELILGSAFVPPMVAGLMVSKFFTGRVDRGAIRPILLAMSAFAAPLLIVRAMMSE